jgi:hypothetical protein
MKAALVIVFRVSVIFHGIDEQNWRKILQTDLARRTTSSASLLVSVFASRVPVCLYSRQQWSPTRGGGQ